MAKTSSIVKYRRSLKLVERYRELRKQLKEIIRNPNSTDEQRAAAVKRYSKIPKRALPVRMKTRCEITGRTRAVYRKFMLTRHKFRELAHKGLLPGVSKASW